MKEIRLVTPLEPAILYIDKHNGDFYDTIVAYKINDNIAILIETGNSYGFRYINALHDARLYFESTTALIAIKRALTNNANNRKLCVFSSYREFCAWALNPKD